jgi:hypothetical protein
MELSDTFFLPITIIDRRGADSGNTVPFVSSRDVGTSGDEYQDVIQQIMIPQDN